MSIIGWVRRAFGWGAAGPTHTFSGPMPIDQLWLDMKGSTSYVGRDEALRIPGVLKGRNLLCSLATLPLTERGPDNKTVRAPLLEQIDPNVPNVVVLARTFEDLLFDAVAWWRVTDRGADGYPTSARHLPAGTVELRPPDGAGVYPSTLRVVDPDERFVWVDGKPVAARDMIRFDSPNPALLAYAGRTFTLARRYADAASMYAKNPQASEHFVPADNVAEPEYEDVRDALEQWMQARRNGSTGYVPRWLKHVPGDSPTAADMKLPELKQQAALETALCMGLDPEVLGVPVTSRTYANRQDFARDRINDVLAPYMQAVSQRLSMMDVCRRGYIRVFDLDDYLRADPVTRWTVYGQATAMGAMSVEQVQQEEGLPVGAVTPPAAPARDELAARRGRAVGFAGPAPRTFEFAGGAEFSVDTAKRTITGLALPYGEIASKYGFSYRFAKGSLEWSEVGRVKFLRDHDYGQALGVATDLRDTDAGFVPSFRIGAGPDRDAVLQDAADGILDGLSVGVEFDDAVDTVPDPDNKGVLLVRRATLREVSLTAMPAFDSARVTKVAARRDGGIMEPCATCGTQHAPGVACPTPAPVPAGPVTLTAEQFSALLAGRPAPTPAPAPADPAPAPADPGPVPVDPAGPDTRRGPVFVREAAPYRRDRRGNFVIGQEHDFSTDFFEMARSRDGAGQSEAGKRVMGMLAHTFDVDTLDINEVTPEIQRPDLYVDQRDYRYPLFNSMNRGAPPNGVQPFRFPKFSSATGLVAAHTEGTEPTGGTLVTTSQVVTPAATSGKAYITREVWDMGGNPAVSTLIFNQMVKGYNEARETAIGTYLNTLTAATDIALGVAVVDEALQLAWDRALVDLQYIRGYEFDFFAVEQYLFKAFADAVDNDGRKLYSMINPVNANGSAARRYTTIDLGGVTAVPTWGLGAGTGGAVNNSWLYDSSTMHAWSTPPQRLEFPGGSDDNTTYAPVAKVGIGIWGYTAIANSDIGGVRQVTYDNVS
jgi:HK97 family phage prohead protease